MIMIGITELTVCIIIIWQLFAQHKMINDINCDKSSSYLQNVDEIFSHFRYLTKDTLVNQNFKKQIFSSKFCIKISLKMKNSIFYENEQENCPIIEFKLDVTIQM